MARRTRGARLFSTGERRTPPSRSVLLLGEPDAWREPDATLVDRLASSDVGAVAKVAVEGPGHGKRNFVAHRSLVPDQERVLYPDVQSEIIVAAVHIETRIGVLRSVPFAVVEVRTEHRGRVAARSSGKAHGEALVDEGPDQPRHDTCVAVGPIRSTGVRPVFAPAHSGPGVPGIQTTQKRPPHTAMSMKVLRQCGQAPFASIGT